MRKGNETISIKAIEAVLQISEQLGPCPDLRIQSLTPDHRPVVVVYWLDGLVDDVRLQEAILATRNTKRIHTPSSVVSLMPYT